MSILYLVPNIWFDVDVNDSVTIKINIYMSTTHLKILQQRNRVGAVFSFHIQYLHPEKIVAKSYRNRDERDVLKYMRVVHKEDKV